MFKSLLKTKKISQAALAKELNITQQLVSSWCIGRCQPNISQLRPLCRILKVDINTIIDCFDENAERRNYA